MSIVSYLSHRMKMAFEDNYLGDHFQFFAEYKKIQKMSRINYCIMT